MVFFTGKYDKAKEIFFALYFFSGYQRTGKGILLGEYLRVGSHIDIEILKKLCKDKCMKMLNECGRERKTIKQLEKVERPREKLMQYGPGKLSNSELLAILLGTGRRGMNVVKLSQNIFKRFEAETLAEQPMAELRKVAGIGEAKACQIVACFELGRRVIKSMPEKIYLSPEDVWMQLIDIRARKKEYFVIFYLDSRNRELQKRVISIGTLNASLVHPREVFEPAVRDVASHIIIAHNHPSGDPTPSNEDMEVTERLKQAGRILGIEVVDHVIVCDKQFVSLREKGKM
jgi:DNA repair protein RadC